MQPPTPWSESGTGSGEEWATERVMWLLLSPPGSRVVDPDEGSGHVSCSPGSYCPLQQSPDTLFIGVLLIRSFQRLSSCKKICTLLKGEMWKIWWVKSSVNVRLEFWSGWWSVSRMTPTRLPFQCLLGVRLNSSLIGWLFTGQCEMPTLLQCGSGKVGVSLAFVWPVVLEHEPHCSKADQPAPQTLLCPALSRAAWPFPSSRSGQGHDFGHQSSVSVCPACIMMNAHWDRCPFVASEFFCRVRAGFSPGSAKGWMQNIRWIPSFFRITHWSWWWQHS